ncbi:PfkB family carbohydrate kinase [Streptomyces sp. NPDC005374]|uniref:PfkB family carbohydrate kinase n=1 Tax=Streptomyces sp. NPDC005374 TaxID=3364713 RepID=UPI0036D021B6
MTEPVQQFDVISMGRIGVDLYPLQTGVRPAQARSFGKSLGGSAANVAIAVARLGRSAAVITRTGTDPFGTYLHQTLTEFGVDNRWVTPVAASSTPVTFCGALPPEDLPLHSYRHPEAPDLGIHTDELDFFAIRAARILWITGTGLSDEPSRSATLAALKCRDRAATTVLDLDRRPALRNDTARTNPDEVRPYYAEALRRVTVAVGTLDECETATGARGPRACADALLAAGVALAVVKQGTEGVLAVHRDGTTAEVRPVPAGVVDGPGAGDAFGGALCHGLLSGWELERILRYADAAHMARTPVMPAQAQAQAQVDSLLDGASP